MKIYIEVEGKYILLNGEKDYSNHEDEARKIEVLEEALDKIDLYKEKTQITRQRRGGYKVLKLGVHPLLKNH